MIDLHGVVVPTPTPLTSTGDVDAEAVGRLVEHLLGGGADGLFVLGSCGEGPTLDRAQRVAAVRSYAAATRGRVPVLAGVAETSLRRAEEALADVVEAGADAVVLSAPFYYTGAGEEYVENHLGALARWTSLPVVLYNIPRMTQNPVTPGILERLGRLPNVVAVKDSSADWETFTALHAAAGAAGLAAFQGAESLVAASVLAGAAGAVPGIATVCPRLATDLVAAATQGRAEAAADLQSRLDDVCTLYEAGYWLVALKAAAAELGLGEPHTTLGLPPLGPDALDRVRAVLARQGLTRQGATHAG